MLSGSIAERSRVSYCYVLIVDGVPSSFLGDGENKIYTILFVYIRDWWSHYCGYPTAKHGNSAWTLTLVFSHNCKRCLLLFCDVVLTTNDLVYDRMKIVCTTKIKATRCHQKNTLFFVKSLNLPLTNSCQFALRFWATSKDECLQIKTTEFPGPNNVE